MPQGKRKDFSGKQKRLALLQKRASKQEVVHDRKLEVAEDKPSENETKIQETSSGDQSGRLIQDVPLSSSSSGKSKYDLRFRMENKIELAKLREDARKPLKAWQDDSEEGWELGLGEELFPDDLSFPKRPKWTNQMSKKEVEANESRTFREFVGEILDKYDQEGAKKKVSHFELNLETWRQLWRVIEMSDILLLVVDSRYPSAMFPPSLYTYVRSLGKDMIVVLNKVDLVPPSLAIAWKHALIDKYPELQVTFFSSCPSYNLRVGLKEDQSGLKYRRMRGKIRMVTEGAEQVWKACQHFVNKAKAEVEMKSWQDLISSSDRHCAAGFDPAGHELESHNVRAEEPSAEEEDFSRMRQVPKERFANGMLSLGMVGQPNAGKSSLINSLMGKRVVSVSKTPGHTKHFQTIFITKNVRLCDCPGLVFPSLVPKPLQVIMGSYPISQVRELMSNVKFLAMKVNLPKLLKIDHPDKDRGTDPEDQRWSAFDICEAWAFKRGYVNARSNRPDINRAANHILRMTLEGKITLSVIPEEYRERKESWEVDEGVEDLKKLLGLDEPAEGDLDEEEEDQSQESEGDDDLEKGDEDKHIPVAKNAFSALMDMDD